MPKGDQIIFVTGSTGKQGGAVARHLLDNGYAVRALTRHPDKPEAKKLAAAGAQIIHGDLDDPASYRSAARPRYRHSAYHLAAGVLHGKLADVRAGVHSRRHPFAAASPSTNLQQSAVDDIGAFVSLAFENPDRWLGRELDIAGDDRAMTDIAAAFGRVIGRPVQYAQMPRSISKVFCAARTGLR